MSEQKIAISVRDVYKTYDGQKFVLKGLNMTVEKGTIYGLLGPSGCGKSSLLNAMVGLVGLDGGEMFSITENKSDMGFMPQQIALHERLTVEEHMQYFGLVYGLTKKQIAHQSDELLGLLEISARSAAEVSTLSGGQKRRLSLAVTLIHNPSLILLDEPTVGVDPVLRESIWTYLKRLTAKEGKTVIVTTHYMEEATLADKIGLMRCGVLICEDRPANVVTQNNATSLEDVFVKLSHMQEAEILENNQIMAPADNRKISKNRKVTKNSRPLEWHRLKAELTKNFKFIQRDMGTTLMVIVVPIVVALCFHFAIGQEPVSRLGILSEEVPHSTSTCLNWEPTSCSFANLTCIFLNKLWTKNIITRDVPDLQSGLDMVKHSKSWGVIQVHRNFSNFMYQLSNSKVLNQGDEDQLAFEHGSLKIHLDRSNAIMDEILTTHLYNSMQEAMADIYEGCEWPSKLPKVPIKVEKLFYGQLTTDVRKSTSPALINIIMLTIPMMYGVIAIIEERVSGATARSVAAGVTPYELLASHFGVQLFIHTSQLLGVAVVIYGLLGYEFENPIVGLSLLFLQGLPGIAISFFMPLIIETPFLANYYCCGFIVANAISCGAIWPIEALHPLAQTFAWLLPTYYSSPALRDANFKGWDVSWRTLVNGYISLGVWTSVLFVAIIVRVRTTQNRCFLGKN